MKSDFKKERVAEDEIVVDGRDVDRAREEAVKRCNDDPRVEHVVKVSDDETLTSRPAGH